MAGCEADPTSLLTSPSTVVTDPTPATPEPPEPPPVTFGPAVVVDDLHIAGLFEDPNAFSLLGLFVDPLIADQITAGTLLLGLELRGVEDPDLRDDDTMSVGLYSLVDDDGDVADNFIAGAPETYTVAAESLADDAPAVEFVDGVLAGGTFVASGVGALDAATLGLPLPLGELSIEGEVVVVEGRFHSLEEGRLRGAVGVSLLALSPNLLAGTCPGTTLLDVFVSGCGFFGQQPDWDADGDGLEKLYDDDLDGTVDRCVDGYGTEILGTDCPQNAAIADGYTLVMVVHGVGADLAAPADGSAP